MTNLENAEPRPTKRQARRAEFTRRRAAGLRRRHQRKRQRALKQNLAALAAEFAALREGLAGVERLDQQAAELAARIATYTDNPENGGRQ